MSYALEMVEQRLNDERQQIESMVLNGGCTSFEAYRYHCGRLDQIRQAMNILDEVEKNLLEE